MLMFLLIREKCNSKIDVRHGSWPMLNTNETHQEKQSNRYLAKCLYKTLQVIRTFIYLLFGSRVKECTVSLIKCSQRNAKLKIIYNIFSIRIRMVYIYNVHLSKRKAKKRKKNTSIIKENFATEIGRDTK